jgi:2-methylcitrate dehydratase PrpD
MRFAETFAEFVVTTRRKGVPPEALAAAKLRLIDGIGVALAALGAASVVRPGEALSLFGSGGEATAIGVAQPSPVAAAVLNNGLLMHGLEFDDTHLGGVVHGAPVVIPPALALAERDGLPGPTMLAAMCVGWEVLVRIGAALRGALQPHGFQATSVAGPLAAAATAAHLLGLDARRTADAIGIAGSQSSGVFEFLASGATSKALHGGWAALGGAVAAALAADGMTGPPAILEGRHGLFAAFARQSGIAERLADGLGDLGTRWSIVEARPKAAPTCHYVLAFLECLDEVLAGGVHPAEIHRIRCFVDRRQAQLIAEPWEAKRLPASPYAAKWSLPYCLAARAILGRVDVELFERPIDPTLVDFAERIDWQPVDDGFPDRYPGRLAVTLADGREIAAYVADVAGGPGRPVPEAALFAKFRDNARFVLPEVEAEELLDELVRLDRADSPARVAALLRRARRPAANDRGRVAVSAVAREMMGESR